MVSIFLIDRVAGGDEGVVDVDPAAVLFHARCVRPVIPDSRYPRLVAADISYNDISASCAFFEDAVDAVGKKRIKFAAPLVRV